MATDDRIGLLRFCKDGLRKKKSFVGDFERLLRDHTAVVVDSIATVVFISIAAVVVVSIAADVVVIVSIAILSFCIHDLQR